MDDETVDGMTPAEQEIWNAGFNEAVRLGDLAADDVTVAMVEIKALRADLEALTVAARKLTDIEGWVPLTDRNAVGVSKVWQELDEALARPGVQEALDTNLEGEG